MAHYSQRSRNPEYQDNEERPRYRKPRMVKEPSVPEDGSYSPVDQGLAMRMVKTPERAQELRERQDKERHEFYTTIVGEYTEDGHTPVLQHPCEADNFSDYVRLCKERQVWFFKALRINGEALMAFRNWDDHGRTSAKGLLELNEKTYTQIRKENSSLRAKIRELQEKYEPFEVFREELVRHDWYYSYSDDGRVYNAGVEREKKLTEKAKELGQAGIDLFNEIAGKNGRTKNI